MDGAELAGGAIVEAFARPATDPARFGITPSHWRTVASFAALRRYIVALRTGKTAAVPWIEQGFPAKPLELKVKVDRDRGLLIARTPAERALVQTAGRPVLEAVAELNRRFGTPRILHGTEAQYSGSLAHDVILRYFPDQDHVFRQ